MFEKEEGRRKKSNTETGVEERTRISRIERIETKGRCESICLFYAQKGLYTRDMLI